MTEIQRKKPPRKQLLPARARDEEEAEEEEEEEQISASKENRKLVGEVRKLRVTSFKSLNVKLTQF